MDILDKVINLKYENSTNTVTLSKALLIFYLLIANNYTKDLYSGQLSQYIQNNRLGQHFIGYLTMIVIMTSFAGITDIKMAIIYSTIVYAFFIITTKLDLIWNLGILFILIFAYLYETNLDNKEKKLGKDQAIDKNDIKRIKRKNNRMKKIILASVLIVSIIGFFFYFKKKKEQYGGNFDIDKFIFEKGKKSMPNR